MSSLFNKCKQGCSTT